MRIELGVDRGGNLSWLVTLWSAADGPEPRVVGLPKIRGYPRLGVSAPVPHTMASDHQRMVKADEIARMLEEKIHRQAKKLGVECDLGVESGEATAMLTGVIMTVLNMATAFSVMPSRMAGAPALVIYDSENDGLVDVPLRHMIRERLEPVRGEEFEAKAKKKATKKVASRTTHPAGAGEKERV